MRIAGATIEPRLPPTVENAFFRIVQEAFTNITRHADASQIDIQLRNEKDAIVLSITDNGVGFNHQSMSESVERRGWGVVNMRERADAVGAKLHIETIQGNGTTIRVTRAKEML